MTSRRDKASALHSAEGAPSPPKKRRKALTKRERQEADALTAERLSKAGRKPFRSTTRLFEDIEVEFGRIFTRSPYRERWLFATEGGRRAARLALEFDLFKTTHDLSNVRHFGFRPTPSPKGDQARKSTKAEIGDLREELARFAHEYDKWINKIVHERLIEPILTFIHVRFDAKLLRWDVHAHCIWIVQDSDLDEVFQRVAAKFSTPWFDEKRIHNVGALVNYCGQWVVDYRQQRHWPDAALVEFWDLGGPRLIRPAGAFAKFRRGLKGLTLHRAGDQVTVAERASPRRYEARYHGPERDGVVGYARLKLDGCKRLCAIRAQRAEDARPSTPAALPFGRDAPDVELSTSASSESRDREFGQATQDYPTASTGLTPPPVIETRAVVASLPLVPPSRAWWWKAWPYGGHRQHGVCRPIARRLAKLAASSSSRAMSTRGGSPAGRWWATESIIKAQRGRSLSTAQRGSALACGPAGSLLREEGG